MRTFNKNKSRLQLGIEKVTDRQDRKEKVHRIDCGMNTYITYKNRDSVYCAGLWASRYAFQWQPLKYVIKRIAHTTYTYEVSKLPMAQQAIKSMKRKQQKRQTS